MAEGLKSWKAERARAEADAAWRRFASAFQSFSFSAFPRHSSILMSLLRWRGQPARSQPLMKRSRSAVEHGLGVARLDAGAQVLDHLVRLEHVAANLAAPADLALLRRRTAPSRCVARPVSFRRDAP